MAIRKKSQLIQTSEESAVENDSTEEMITHSVPEEPKIFVSQWIHKYGHKYKKDELGVFKYKIDRYALGVRTPSEWQGLLEGTIPFPSKVGK